MDGEELAALYEVQREIGDIFTSMKRNGTEESEAHKEASLNLEKSAQMVSQLNDFIEKYGSDTLEESDALAAAVVAEAEYINTLKGKIEDILSQIQVTLDTLSLHLSQLETGVLLTLQVMVGRNLYLQNGT